MGSLRAGKSLGRLEMEASQMDQALFETVTKEAKKQQRQLDREMTKALVSEATQKADSHFNLFRQEEIGQRVKERLEEKEFNLQNSTEGPSVTKVKGLKDADTLGNLAGNKPWYCKKVAPSNDK